VAHSSWDKKAALFAVLGMRCGPEGCGPIVPRANGAIEAAMGAA
jgi:hypothetical protein